MDCWNKAKIYESEMNKFYNRIENGENINEYLSDMYKYVKEISPYFYSDGKIDCSYKYLKDRIFECEQILPNKFICDSDPIFNVEVNKHINIKMEPEIVLDSLVYNIRKYLLTKLSFVKGLGGSDINLLSFENSCFKASETIQFLCNINGIKSRKLEIYPGFCAPALLFNGGCLHFANIVQLNKKYYLVDCTYRQFFTFARNNLERIGIMEVAGCKPGIFMLMNEERKKVADTLLKRGWIELDENVLKYYMDGFAISFRNGLYYEQTGDFSYTTNYTASDYERFLFGSDTQIWYEGDEVLGYQKRPLQKIF